MKFKVKNDKSKKRRRHSEEVGTQERHLVSQYKLTKLDHIWNRACDSFSTAPLEVGDRALRGILQAHGLICNGGVFHVFNVLTQQDIEAAKAGYRFFGLPEIADLLLSAREILDTEGELHEHAETFDSEYARFIPEDSDLVDRFRKHQAAKPSDFAPLAGGD